MRIARSLLLASILVTPLTLIAGVTTVAEEECIAYDDYFHLRTILPTPGQGQALAVSGNYVYFADRSGLLVIDISDPDAPTITGSVDTPGEAFDVAVSGNYAYVAQWSAGLQVIDVTDPTAPILAGAIDTFVLKVAAEGSYAYLASGTDGVKIVDATDPFAPFVVGSVPLLGTSPGAFDVAVSGDHAYVAAISDWSYLQVVDVSSPSTPAIVGMLESAPGYSDAVTVHQGRAYMGMSSGARHGFGVVDISDPTTPALTGSYLFDEDLFAASIQDIAISGDIAYAACVGGICAFDVAQPDQPRLMGIVGRSNVDAEVGVASSAEHLWVATDVGFRVYGGSLAGPAPLVGSVDFSRGFDVAVSEGYAYVTAGSDGIQVVDVTDLGAPRIKTSVTTPDIARDVAVSGDHAYVVDDSGLRVVDISDPAAAFIEGSLDTPGGGPNDVAVRDSTAYVAADDGGLQVIDVSNPAAPSLTGALPLVGNTWGIAVDDRYAYVTSSGAFHGLHIIDIASSGSPDLIGSVETSGSARDLTVSAGYAFVVVTGVGLEVIDLSDPSTPLITGTLPVLLPYDVDVFDHYAYVTNGIGGVQVIDVTDPTSPIQVGMLETPGLSRGVTVSGQHVYVTTIQDPIRKEPAGLRIGRLQCDSATLDVDIDVKPGSDSTPVPCRLGRGVIPVAILTTDDFSALDVDQASVTFGPGGAMETHETLRGPVRHEEDVDADGDIDLVLHFRLRDAEIECGASEVELTGMTFDGQGVRGSDGISTVGHRR